MLPWHRHFLWELEQVLRSECNYKGYLPYWDYAKYLGRPTNQNPLFDGSQTSIGGDGTGLNGCVEDGPFANFTVNMPPPDESSRQQRNPSCIKRHFTPGIMEEYASYEKITRLLHDSTDIQAFHSQLESPDGLHVNPHSYIGGLQNNIYLSSQDPWFFLHHAMIDRVWAIWQSADFDRRGLALDASTNFDSRKRLNCKLPSTLVPKGRNHANPDIGLHSWTASHCDSEHNTLSIPYLPECHDQRCYEPYEWSVLLHVRLI